MIFFMTTPVALVTGGTRGIGLGIAAALAGEGYTLVLCGMRTRDGCTESLEALESLGSTVHYFQCDVAEPSQRAAMLDGVRQSVGALNLLVNNAGMAPTKRADILEASEASFERLIQVNLQGPYFLTQAVANQMISQKREDSTVAAAIVNITSISSAVASVNRGDYCISKAGLSMTTALWAARLGEFGISVYEVRPGIIETDMTAGAKEKYDTLIRDGLLLQPRWGTPEDIGKTVAALARGDLPYSTGAVIMADGGLTVDRL